MKRFAIFLLACLIPFVGNSRVLKEDTATQVAIGPFIDGTDFITPETGLTVTAWDCGIIKHADSGMSATSITITASGGSNDAAHLDNGVYSLELTATDTSTAGRLKLVCDHATPSTFLAVSHEWMVMPTQEYASLYGTDVLNVDVTQWLGTAAATPTTAGVPEVDVTYWAGNAATASSGNPDVNVESQDNIDFGATQKASINTEVDTGLSDIGLNHLMAASVTGTDVTDNSVIAKLASSSATADWDSFVNTTDSLQAIADSGGGGPTAAQIVDEWETQSQADPTGFHVNVLEVGGTSQTANDNGADINAILVDTTGLNGDAMRGTDNAFLAANAPTNFEDLNITNTTGLVRPDMANASGNYSGTVATVTTLTGHTAQTADHTAGIADIPTVAEFNARTLVAASYFDPAADTVATVTTTTTATTCTNLGANAVDNTSTNLTETLNCDALAISGDTTAANNAESFFDGTGYAGTGNTIPTVTDVTNLHASAATATALATVDTNVDDIETRLGTPSDLGGGATVAGNLSDIEGQTDDIGVAGVGLTATGIRRETGTMASAAHSSTSAYLEAGEITQDNQYKHWSFTVTSGDCTELSGRITDSTDASELITVSGLDDAGANCDPASDFDSATYVLTAPSGIAEDIASVSDTTSPMQVDSSGYFKVSDGTGAGQIALTAGAVDKANVASMDASVIGQTQLDYCGTGIKFTVQNDAANSATQVATDLSDTDYADDQFGGSSIPKRAVVFQTGNVEGLAATIQSFDTTGGAAEDLLGFSSIGTEPDAGVIGCIF